MPNKNVEVTESVHNDVQMIVISYRSGSVVEMQVGAKVRMTGTGKDMMGQGTQHTSKIDGDDLAPQLKTDLDALLPHALAMIVAEHFA